MATLKIWTLVGLFLLSIGPIHVDMQYLEYFGTACDEQILGMQCPANYVIVLDEATYGRKDSTICRSVSSDDGSNDVCEPVNVISTIQSLCQGKEKCDVRVGSALFGEPCKGVPKYLDVDFHCEPILYSDVQCASRSLQLDCPDGYIIRIKDAMYGRLDSSTCSRDAILSTNNTNCESSGSSSVVSALCNNRQSCEVIVGGGLFADPCPDTDKYLTASYVCTECKNLNEKEDDCKTWADGGECESNTAWMEVYCRKACLDCEHTQCLNQYGNDDSCNTWAANKECDTNPDWMERNCAKSCHVCSEPESAETTLEPTQTTLAPTQTTLAPTQTTLAPTPASQRECVNEQTDRNCSEWFRLGECENNPTWMWFKCYKTCSRCDCYNKHNNETECSLWEGREVSECSGNNQDWMWSNCYRSCSLCEGVTVTKKAWFDITIDNDPVGRIVLGLFGKIVPKSVNNVVALANHTYGFGYRGSIFHRVIQDFVAQGGDITQGNGYGGRSIYGGNFEDENFTLKHYGKGWVNFANNGNDTNESMFAILDTRTYWLDNKHVVFAKVLEGYNVVEQILATETNVSNNDRPLKEIKVVDTGVSDPTERLEVEKKDITGDGEQCDNKHQNDGECEAWYQNGDCYDETHANWMWTNCYESCSRCHVTFTDTYYSVDETSITYSLGGTGLPERECVNLEGDDGLCDSWANQGECERNPDYMNDKCHKACSRCQLPDVCKNNHQDPFDCLKWALAGDCVEGLQRQWMWDHCREACSKCSCNNKHPDDAECSQWAVVGDCQGSEYGAWMWNNCWAACSRCGDVVLESTTVTMTPSTISVTEASTSTQMPECRNEHGDDDACENYAKGGDCVTRSQWMQINCFKACSGCRDQPCVNLFSNSNECLNWKNSGECEKNQDWMYLNCYATCSGCVGQTESITTISTSLGTTASTTLLSTETTLGPEASTTTPTTTTTTALTSPATTNVPSTRTTPVSEASTPLQITTTVCANIVGDATCKNNVASGLGCDSDDAEVQRDMIQNCYKTCSYCDNQVPNGYSPTGNPLVTDIVYLDVFIGGKEAGRIFIGLFGGIVPKTTLNFILIATNAFGYSFAGSSFNQVSLKTIEGGRIENHDSIYGRSFEDENYKLRHWGPGWVGMSTSTAHDNGSEFYITVDDTPEMNEKHVVFGKIVGGMTAVYKIAGVSTDAQYTPREKVEIRSCGNIAIPQPFMVLEEGVYL